MSSNKSASASFLQRYMNGEVPASDIDDFIDDWHEKPGKKAIYEFLGMTKEEYELWLRDPELLPQIVRARRTNSPLVSMVRTALTELLTTTGSADAVKVRRLRQ